MRVARDGKRTIGGRGGMLVPRRLERRLLRENGNLRGFVGERYRIPSIHTSLHARRV